MMTVNWFRINRNDLKVLMLQRKDDAVKALDKYEGPEWSRWPSSWKRTSR
jgi:hypothetical protein